MNCCMREFTASRVVLARSRVLPARPTIFLVAHALVGPKSGPEAEASAWYNIARIAIFPYGSRPLGELMKVVPAVHGLHG